MIRRRLERFLKTLASNTTSPDDGSGA